MCESKWHVSESKPHELQVHPIPRDLLSALGTNKTVAAGIVVLFYFQNQPLCNVVGSLLGLMIYSLKLAWALLLSPSVCCQAAVDVTQNRTLCIASLWPSQLHAFMGLAVT